MSLLERIKGMFSRTPLPDETQRLLSCVEDVEELRRGLDGIATENEVRAREIEREIESLARKEALHKTRVAEGTITDREKLNTLREIQRLRRRMDSLEKRHKIHQDNIDLHLGLFDRITEMQAMEMKRVTQGQIEEIAVDYEEKLEKHRDIMTAARAAAHVTTTYESTAERRELEALEREILAEAGKLEEEEEERPAAVRAPAASEPAAAEEEPEDVEDEGDEADEEDAAEEEPDEGTPEPSAGRAAAPARPDLDRALRDLKARDREQRPAEPRDVVVE